MIRAKHTDRRGPTMKNSVSKDVAGKIEKNWPDSFDDFKFQTSGRPVNVPAKSDKPKQPAKKS